MSDGHRKRQLRSGLFKILRAGFRALPMSIATRDALRERFLTRFPSIRPSAPQGQPLQTLERRPRVHSAERAIGYVERRHEPLPDPLPATLVAFYLPQFHTIPENDAWWGKGFTEWRNVTRALPQFEGHQQPRLPGDLGFYDLRNPQVLRDQAELAQSYGIGAFCMYFYWFGGKTLLELPHQQWLNDPTITLPICLCWANEDWTRTWDGRAGEILIAQQHSPEDDLAFIAHIARYLRDPRYLRIEGKPLLLVYRPGKLPDPKATAARWRAWCRDNGIGEIHLAYVQSFERPDPRDIGFDSAVEFPPNQSSPLDITSRQRLFNQDYRGNVSDWRDVAHEFTQRSAPSYWLMPGVNCGWDNEPRASGRGRILLHASPNAFQRWLSQIIRSRAVSDHIVFINAWNEWAEGAVLEPDASYGYAWLEAARKALHSAQYDNVSGTLPVYAIVHAWYTDIFESIADSLARLGTPLHVIVTTARQQQPSIERILSRHRLNAEIEICENRGRDILPFLRVAQRLRAVGDGIVLKLHTKRSPHRSDGDKWRDELIRALASPDRAESIIRAFQRDLKLGIVAPEAHLLPLNYYWGANAGNVESLLTRMGLPPATPERASFISGSMFWARLSALDPVLDAALLESDFETERGEVDGTLAHAVERILVLCAAHHRYRCTTAELLCGLSPPGRKYPYARVS